MIYFGLGVLYVVLLITLGIFTIRKGHWVMFIIGIFFPLFWFIGAVLPPTTSRVRTRLSTSSSVGGGTSGAIAVASRR